MHSGMGPYPQNNSMGNYGAQGGQYGPQGESSWQMLLVLRLLVYTDKQNDGECGVDCSTLLSHILQVF